MLKNNALILAGLALIIGLFFVFKPQTPATTKTDSVAQSAKVFDLTITNKKITAGPAKIEVTEGDDVVLRVTSDTSGELHLHGYDKSVDLVSGKTVDLAFRASVTGSFPYELEDTKTELGSVEVAPK